MLLSCLLLLVLPLFTSALHESEAGVVDWHKENIGIPLKGSPKIHRTVASTGKGFLITATASNVLAALNPANGQLAWRHAFEKQDEILHWRAMNHTMAVLSGPGGAKLRVFTVKSGILLWDAHLHPYELGRLSEPAQVGSDIAFVGEKSSDILALTNGHTLRRISPTGTLWTWSSEDSASLIVYNRIINTPNAIYLVGLTKSFSSFTLHITSVDPESGKELGFATIPSDIPSLSNYLITLQPSPRVIWLERKGDIYSVTLTPELRSPARSPASGSGYTKIIDVGLELDGWFVALGADGSAKAMRVDAIRGVEGFWDFADSEKSLDWEESIFAGGHDRTHRPYIARTYWSHMLGAASLHLLAPHGADGKGLLTGMTFPFNTTAHGVITDVTLEAANPSEYTYVSRAFLTTSTGTFQLWMRDQKQWTREEGLAHITTTVFVDLPEESTSPSKRQKSYAGGILNRLLRHAVEMRKLPAYIVRFGNRFVTGDYGTAIRTTESTSLVRDAFGFRKLVLLFSSTGKLFAIDSTDGRLVWDRLLGLSQPNGPDFEVKKVFTLKTVWDGMGTRPEIMVIGERDSLGMKNTVVFHIDALTGQIIRRNPRSPVLPPDLIFSGPCIDSFLVTLDNGRRVIVLLDQDMKVHLYPNDRSIQASFSSIAHKVHIPLHRSQSGSPRLQGYQVKAAPTHSGKYETYGTWTASIPSTETITRVIRLAQGPIASYGKVLGDRSTLYKYLNPNVIAVITASSPVSPSATLAETAIYILDTVTGAVLFHTPVNSAGQIQASLTENWLVYHYFDAGDGITAESGKGYRIVTVELYEGNGKDSKTNSPDISSYSPDSSKLVAFQQSFVFPHGVTALGTTSTKFGITVKDLIVATDKNQIQSFSRRILDPRRPTQKPTNEEREEMLIPYDPVISDESKRVISHKNDVLGIERIVSSPALLESTSLVLAYGIDVFMTRVTPSNTFDVLSEDFNKLQLVLTVLGLGLAILVAKPMVARKTLRQRWYS